MSQANKFVMRERLTKLCHEMATLGRNTLVSFDELELMAASQVFELTTEPHISKIVMQLCEDVAAQGRYYAGRSLSEIEADAVRKIDSIVLRFCKTRGEA